MTSQARKAFDDHVAALGAGDMDAVVAGYAEDAVLIDTNRIGRGHEFIRSVLTGVGAELIGMRPVTTVHEDGDVIFVSWYIRRDGEDDIVGADTFVCTDGLITLHSGFNSATATA